jgi:uncharacterized protein (UPF0276 family)
VPGIFGGRHFSDVVPLPGAEEAREVVSARIGEAKDFLGREIPLENVSRYLQLAQSKIPEWELPVGAARQSGCGILLHVNNICVSSANHAFDAARCPGAVAAPPR